MRTPIDTIALANGVAITAPVGAPDLDTTSQRRFGGAVPKALIFGVNGITSCDLTIWRYINATLGWKAITATLVSFKPSSLDQILEGFAAEEETYLAFQAANVVGNGYIVFQTEY